MPEGPWNFTLGPLAFSCYSGYHLCSSQIPILSSTSAFHSGVLYFINPIQMLPSLLLPCRHWYLLRLPSDGREGKNRTEKEKLKCRWGKRRGLGGPHKQPWSLGNPQNHSSWGKMVFVCEPIPSDACFPQWGGGLGSLPFTEPLILQGHPGDTTGSCCHPVC